MTDHSCLTQGDECEPLETTTRWSEAGLMIMAKGQFSCPAKTTKVATAHLGQCVAPSAQWSATGQCVNDGDVDWGC